MHGIETALTFTQTNSERTGTQFGRASMQLDVDDDTMAAKTRYAVRSD
jgi:hypothetical protein